MDICTSVIGISTIALDSQGALLESIRWTRARTGSTQETGNPKRPLISISTTITAITASFVVENYDIRLATRLQEVCEELQGRADSGEMSCAISTDKMVVSLAVCGV